MSEHILLTYYDTDKKQEMTIQCDAASLCQSEPSYKGRKATEKATVSVKTIVFQLTDLPKALRAHGKKHTGHAWEKAAKMQEKWFNSPAKVMTDKIKKAEAIDWPEHLVLTEYYTLDWLAKANVTGVVTNGIERLTKGKPKNGRISDITGQVWDREVPSCIYNRAAKSLLQSISSQTERQQAYTALKQSYGDTKNFWSKYKDMQKFHKYFSFQSFSLFDAWDKMALALGNRILKDEFFATVAGCSLAAAIGKYRMPGNKLIVDSVYLYVRDTFDFINEKGEDQYLGHWNHTGFDVFFTTQKSIRDTSQDLNRSIAASGAIAMPSSTFKSKPEDRFFPVRNSHFNKWRNLHKKGGDLLIFSSLKEFRCNPPIEVELK